MEIISGGGQIFPSPQKVGGSFSSPKKVLEQETHGKTDPPAISTMFGPENWRPAPGGGGIPILDLNSEKCQNFPSAQDKGISGGNFVEQEGQALLRSSSTPTKNGNLKDFKPHRNSPGNWENLAYFSKKELAVTPTEVQEIEGLFGVKSRHIAPKWHIWPQSPCKKSPPPPPTGEGGMHLEESFGHFIRGIFSRKVIRLASPGHF